MKSVLGKHIRPPNMYPRYRRRNSSVVVTQVIDPMGYCRLIRNMNRVFRMSR